MNTIIRSLLLNGILLAMFAQGSTNEVISKAEQDAEQKIFSMYLNMPDRCIRLGEEVPIVMTIVNHTDEPLYIHDIEIIIPFVNSVNGNDVPVLIDEDLPPLASIDDYMVTSGELIPMQKVVEIPPMSGRVFVTKNFLKPYKDGLKPGHYYLYRGNNTLDYYQKSQVVIWGDQNPSLRVKANEIRQKTEVTVDIVTFEVLEGDVVRKEDDAMGDAE